VSARAVVTGDGFRLSTALPFLKPDTEVDVLISPDASVSARGRVAHVALDTAGGAPRLLIDLQVDDDGARTPVVQSLLDAVPEHVWEPVEVGATAEAVSLDEEVPSGRDTPVVAAEAITDDEPAPGAVPDSADNDLTEIVSLEARPSRWRALGGGMVAGAIAFSAFVAAIVIMKVAAPPASAPPSIAPPVIITQPTAAAAPSPVAAEPVLPTLPVPEVPAATPVPAAEAPAPVVVGLTGSIAGAKRYPLRSPDGVAFNLPHAHASMKIGTYTPDVPGVKSMWVRPLPGGGTHLRFFFTGARPAPQLTLEHDGVRVGAP
jgi:hypothetical protein